MTLGPYQVLNQTYIKAQLSLLFLLFTRFRQCGCVRAMNRGNGNGARNRLELQLNLSPPVRMEVDDESGSSSPSSCVSSDGSPGSKSPMVIGACTRCLMYCMVAKKDFPICINCKQPCLVDLLQHGAGGGAGTGAGAGASADGDKKRGRRK